MGIIDNAKEIADLIKKYNDQDLYEKIIDLREKILSLKEENIFLKEKLRKYQNAANIAEDLVKSGNIYYKKNDEEKKQPFCMTCWDADQKLVTLIVSGGVTYCTICRKRWHIIMYNFSEFIWKITQKTANPPKILVLKIARENSG